MYFEICSRRGGVAVDNGSSDNSQHQSCTVQSHYYSFGHCERIVIVYAYSVIVSNETRTVILKRSEDFRNL